MSLSIQREVVIKVLTGPPHSSPPGLHLPPRCFLSLSVPVFIFKIISMKCVLRKKVFPFKCLFFHFWLFLAVFFLKILSVMQDCGIMHKVFLFVFFFFFLWKYNMKVRAPTQCNCLEDLVPPFFAEASFKPHCVTVSLFLVYYLVTIPFFLYIVFSILVIEEKENAFSL